MYIITKDEEMALMRPLEIKPGVYQYVPDDNELEQVKEVGRRFSQKI